MNFSLKIKFKRIHAFAICFVLAAILSSPLIITLFLNTNYVKNKVSSVVYEKTGLNIDHSNLSIKVLLKPGIIINRIKIKPTDQIEISIQSIAIDLKLHELIARKLVLDQILITQPKLKTVLPPKKTVTKANLPSLSKYLEILSKGFDFLPQEQETMEIIIRDGISDYFDRMNGSLYLHKNSKKLLVETIVKGIRFSPGSIADPEFKKLINLDSVFVDKVIFNASVDTQNAQKSIKGECIVIKPRLADKEGETLFDTENINIDFALSPKKQQIKVAPIEIKTPTGSVGIDFLNTPEKNESYLKFSGKNIDVGQAREMSQVLFKDIYVSQALFDILLDGIVPKIEVSFQSQGLKDLLNEKNLKLFGNITKGKVHIPETDLIASQINGNAAIEDGVLKVTSPNGMIGTSKIETGDLSVDLLNYDDVPFKGEFFLDVDLAMIPKTLISLLPGTTLARELSKVSTITGQSKTILNLELKPGAKEPVVHVSTKHFSTKGMYDRIPGEISITRVKIKVEPDKIFLNNLTGSANGIKLDDFNTSINFKDDPWININNGSVLIELGKVIPWLLSYKKAIEIIDPIKKGEGSAIISSIKLMGPVLEPDKWEYQALGEIENASFSSHFDKNQIVNLSCYYQISDKIKTIENINAKINGLEFLEHFSKTKYLSSIKTPFLLKNAQLKTDTKPLLFNTNIEFPDGPEINLDLIEDGISSLTFNTLNFVDQDISDTRISFHHDKNKPLFDFRGKFDTRSLSKIIKPQSLLDRKIKEITYGQPLLINRDKDQILNITTKNLNINPFLTSSKENASPKTHLLTKDIINFKAQKLKIKKLIFTDVDTKISFKKGHSYFRIKNADLCGLQTRGYINIKNNKIYADVPLEAKSQKDIQELLSCLLKKDEFMDGPYSFSCNLFSSGIPADEIKNNIQGTLALNAKNGRIYKLTLLSRILSVLNVSEVFKGKIPNVAQKGFAYKNISLKADMKESVIHLKHFIIDGQDMTMIFTGEIDPVNDKINLTCLVAPFKTVDLIIEKIPIVNTLLGGRLISVPVKATGKLSDPTVIPLHPSAVGKGLVDMMSRILKSPITLWEKMLGEDEEK